MLKSIDVLLGLSVIMLFVSMGVTTITQLITNLVNSRGRHLAVGIAALLQQIDPTLSATVRKQIAHKILTHPLISESMGRLGTVIHREELTKLLMELAAGTGPQKLEGDALAALSTTVTRLGIGDPAATLKNIDQFALQQEVSNPELANNVRQNFAILHEAGSDLVAKINAWFDQTIDRVAQQFTLTTHGITLASAFLVAVVLQLDAVYIINSLAVDNDLRNTFVQEAQRLMQQAPAPGQNPTGVSAADQDYSRFLAQYGLLTIPSAGMNWGNQWRWSKLPGILLSTFLLSLGAPFWYNTLKNLLRLRSALAAKDDIQRQERQSSQEIVAAPIGPAPVVASALSGERGDLGAVG